METGNLKEEAKKNEESIQIVRRRLIQREQPKLNERFVFLVRAAVLFLAMASLVGMVISAFSISCSKIIVYLLLLFYSMAFTWYYENHELYKDKKDIKIKYLLLVVAGVNVLLLFFTGNIMLESMYSVFNDIICALNSTYHGKIELLSQQNITGTYFISYLFFWLGAFLAKGIIHKQEYLQFIFVAIPLLVLSFLGGGKPSDSSSALFLLVLICLISFGGMPVRKKYWYAEREEEYSKNKRISRNIQFRLAICLAVAGTILMAVSSYGLSKVFIVPVEKISQATSPMKVSGLQWLYEILPKISGGKLSFSMEGTKGGVSHGELGEVSGFSYDNTEALQLICSRKPQETVYLKGFIGTEYAGSQWKERDKKEFENIVENWNIKENPLIYIQNLPFLRMLYAQKMLGEDDGSRLNNPVEMTVRRLDANIDYTYVPYQTFLSDYYTMQGDGAVAGEAMEEYVYSWFPLKEYQSVIQKWKNQNPPQTALDDISEAYRSYVATVDTKVNENAIEGISGLCRDKKEEWDNKITEDMTREQLDVLEKEKYDDIKQFVVSTLWSNCTFTTEVWKLPKGEDFVSYFFLEKKQGDSTAFASAATLMYRMCGIPARYVVGYAAPSSLFIGNGDGTYTAILQNDNAHAWVEIYMSDYGWTPVETTPGFAGTLVDMEVSEDDLKEQEQVKKEQQEEQQKKDWKNGLEDMPIFGKVLLIVVVFGIVLLMLAARYYYIRKKRRGMLPGCSREEQIKKIFYSFYEVLQFSGFSQEIDTTRKEFVAEVSRKYPQLDKIMLERYMNLVLQVSYGPRNVTKEDILFSISMYEALVRNAANGLTKRKKILFYYWNAF